MKKRVITGSVAALVLAASTLGGETLSLADVIHYQIPVQGTHFVKCAGEAFSFEGIADVTENGQLVSANGRLHFTYRAGLKGKFAGLTSGNLYVGNATFHVVLNGKPASFPQAWTQVENFVAIPEGDYPLIRGKTRIHLIVHADGAPTVSTFEIDDFSCGT